MSKKLLSKHLTGAAAIALSTVFTGGTAALFTPAAAQDYTSGSLSVAVVDAAGAPVSGANVTVRSNSRGTVRSGTTDASGRTFFGRLPIGEYTVSISGSGYQSVSDETVSVDVGSSGTISFTMNKAGADDAGDVIIVTGTRTQSANVGVAETGLVLDVQEVFTEIPLGRNITSLALLSPGSIPADNAFGGASISGSSAGENVFYINGLNITDFRNFLGANTIPFEAYQQVEIKTGGYQAEFGRATGGVINQVTKSGTNEFDFGISAYYTADELREDSPNTVFARNDLDQRTFQEINYQASGPIIKDRLFFYGLYSTRDNEAINISSTGNKNIDTLDDPTWLVKIDAELFDGHRLEYTGINDHRTTVRNNSSVTFAPDGSVSGESFVGTTNFRAGGNIDILKYTGNFSDRLSVSLLAGRQTFDQTTSGTTDANPVILDSRGPTNVFLGNWASFLVSLGEDKREAFRADVDYRADLFGSEHNFRIGMDREDLTAFDRTQYSGGIYYRYFDAPTCESLGGAVGAECVRVRVFQGGGNFTTEQTAFYIQDAWQVTPQLVLELGLRNETFNNKNANGDTFTKIEDQIAPRLSAIYDVRGDGSLELFGSYGRYYLPVATNTNIRLSGAELFTQDYYAFSSINGDDTPNLSGAPFNSAVFGDGTVPDTRSVVDPNLEPMYKDEYILGANWEVSPNFDVTISYTYRDLQQTLEDIAVDAAVNAYCAANGIAGCSSIWSGFHAYVLTNPGSDLTYITDEIPGSTGFQEIQLSAADLGYPKATNTYSALDISGRYDADRFFLAGSVTLSESSGNYEGPVRSDNGQDDAGITTNFDQPGLTDGTDGLLPNHRGYKFKLWGNYEVNDAFNFGGNLSVTSPRKYGCIGYHPTDVFAQLYGAASFYCNSTLTPRGSQLENDWITNLDMNFVYKLETVTAADVSLRMDVFNVFNSDGVTDLQEVGETGLNVADPNYGTPTAYQAPRSIRFGVNVDF